MRRKSDTHQREVDELRGRQLAIIQLLPAEEALVVLAASPVTHSEEQELVADMITRRILASHVVGKLEGEHGD